MLYRTTADLNLYDSPSLDTLATQAARGRWIRCLNPVEALAAPQLPLPVMVVEDDYPAWLAPQDFGQLQPTTQAYIPPHWSADEIRDRLPQVIAFAQVAMTVPNHYLWGGTVAPHYDCSGLMQAAFRSVGIQLPRDAYQQEAFVQPVVLADLIPGDLVFFGPAQKATHVGLYLGDGAYIHSSGQDIGRNGIGIDALSRDRHSISRAYFTQWRGGGRVVQSYCSGGLAAGGA
jgi:hypothetical protein